jgi:hypothetical protein
MNGTENRGSVHNHGNDVRVEGLGSRKGPSERGGIAICARNRDDDFANRHDRFSLVSEMLCDSFAHTIEMTPDDVGANPRN